ncbi:MAG: hypothetical protein RJA70_323 [Pseudomonadota bacterium]|jgi:C1A family cysteine protease
MKIQRTLVTTAISTALALAVTHSVLSQPLPKVKAPVLSAQLKLHTIQLAPDVKQALVGKRAYDASKIQQSLSYLGAIPVLALQKTGAKVQLEAVSAEPQPSAQLKAKSATIDPALSQYRSYIDAPFVLTKRPANLAALLATSVSHRDRQTPIKDQGSRNTCVGMSATAGLESFIKWKNNATFDLSEQHVFEVLMAAEGNQSCNNQGLQTWKAAQYLTASKVCANWDYTTSVPACSISVPSDCAANAKWGHVDTQVVLGTEFGGTGTQTANNTNYLETLIKEGNDLVFGVYVAGADWSDSTIDTGVIDVQMVGGNPAGAYGGHAMLMVGYDRDGKYFEFKNSWGASSGHDGYVRLSYEYVQTYAKYGYYIKAAEAPPKLMFKLPGTLRQQLPPTIKMAPPAVRQ